MTLGSAMSTSSSQAYGESWYWDKRYTEDPGTFDWYQKYPVLAPLLRHYIPKQRRVLLVGCGNSALSEGMVHDGYEDVFNIDISSVVIEAMQKKYSDCPQMKYMKMDVREMSAFESGTFDAVVDKGTLDSILCGQNSKENAEKMLKEVTRVLKDKGIYILITYGAPSYRVHLLRNSCIWTIKLHVIDKLIEESSDHPACDITTPIPLDEDGTTSAAAILGKNPDVHYIYVCTKFSGDSKLGRKNESPVERDKHEREHYV